MYMLLDLIDWDYPAVRTSYTPCLWDLSDESSLMAAVLLFANGTIREVRMEAATDDEVEALRGLAQGCGSAYLVSLTDEQQAQCWLYQAGDECYQQGHINPGFIFINPVAQPQKFQLAPEE